MTDINVPPRPFKVGDEVYCLNSGKANVTEIRDSQYSVFVTFDDGLNRPYTKTGKLYPRQTNRCLFHADEYVQVTVKKNITDPIKYKIQDLESRIEALEELIKHTVTTRPDNIKDLTYG